MADINLLPWREKKREQEKKQFGIYFVAGLIFAGIMVFLINYYALYLVDNQTARNQRLENEISLLEKQIKEIDQIKKLRQALVARMTIVQNLQSTRGLTVHLFDEIIKIMPDGVYLNQLQRIENKVTLLGYAESNTNISRLMRNIESSVWIENPELTEIKKSKETSQRVENEFKLSFVLKPKNPSGFKTP